MGLTIAPEVASLFAGHPLRGKSPAEGADESMAALFPELLASMMVPPQVPQATQPVATEAGSNAAVGSVQTANPGASRWCSVLASSNPSGWRKSSIGGCLDALSISTGQ